MSLPIDADAAALGKVLTSLPVFVLLIDRAGTIRYINRVEPGFDAREVVGSPAESYLVPGSTEVFEAALRSVFDTGEPTEYDAELPMPDGPRRGTPLEYSRIGTGPPSRASSWWRRTSRS